MKLEDWRKEIDSIDAEIVKLVSMRAEIAQKIGAIKAAAGLPVVDATREDEILRNVTVNNKGILKNEAIIGIFQRIISESRKLQIATKPQLTSEKEIL